MNKSVAIAGGGIIGGAIAWRLAQAGLRVELFEAGAFGGQTSSAGAGMLSPGGEFDKPSAWVDLGVEGMRMYPAFVQELRAESGVPIDFRICGCAHYADPETADRRAAFQSSVGIRVERTPDGLFYPEDGFVDPTDVLRALRTACEARGVNIHEHQPIASIESAEYSALVIAAGAWSDQIAVRHRGDPLTLASSRPVKGHLIGFDLEPGTLGAMRRQGHTYILQRSSGFTIAGSNEEHCGFDPSVDPAICEEIHRRVTTIYPPLAGAAPSKRWIGFRPFSEGGPHIRRVERTNVWLAYGHFRNGILLAPLTAHRIAGEIAGLF
jgi:glycine oxidase